jgi:hypothetical protein
MWFSTSDATTATKDATTNSTARRRRRGRLVALGILVICAVPLAAAIVAFYFFPPTGRVNYGELIEPRLLPATSLMRIDGHSFSLGELKGKWVMLQADSSDCTARCRAKLFNMRQVRLAQGKNMERIDRVWLLLDAGQPPAELQPLYQGTIVVRDGAAFVAALPASDVRDHVFLIDPLGFAMLRFPKDADPKRMIKDLERLLKYSAR